MKSSINWPALSRAFRLKPKKLKSSEGEYIENSVFTETEGANDFNIYFNRRKIIFTVISLLVLLFAQEAFFNSLRIFDAKPQLVLCFLVIISSMVDVRPAMYMGLASGLLCDICYGRFFGFYGLLFMYVCLFTSIVIGKNLKGRPFFFYTITPFLLLFYLFVQGFLSRLLIIYSSTATVLYYDFPAYIFEVLVPEFLYNYFCIALLYIPARLVFGKFGKKSLRTGIVFNGGQE